MLNWAVDVRGSISLNCRKYYVYKVLTDQMFVYNFRLLLFLPPFKMHGCTFHNTERTFLTFIFYAFLSDSVTCHGTLLRYIIWNRTFCGFVRGPTQFMLTINSIYCEKVYLSTLVSEWVSEWCANLFLSDTAKVGIGKRAKRTAGLGKYHWFMRNKRNCMSAEVIQSFRGDDACFVLLNSENVTAHMGVYRQVVVS